LIKIEFITEHSFLFQDVISLGKKHSATLGFMLDGGFIDHARKKWIIIARSGSELLGYLMYRIVPRKSRISIVHLCIKEESRGKNVSTQLLSELRQKYEKHYAGISLSCRADYKYASSLWQKFGFICKGRIRSRSIEENYLYKWWYDFNMTNLFSLLESQSEKIKAVLDANIIMKLRDNSVSDPSQDPQALLADWLVSEVDYYYAPEILNEIARDKDVQRAENTRKFLGNFYEARFDMEECKIVSSSIKSIIPGNTDNDNSDRKQLASCIVSDITYFITLDQGIINAKEEIEKDYNIQIFSPQEFILRIDQLFNSKDYTPVKLSGVSFHTISNVSYSELETYIDLFLMKTRSEKKLDFKNKVLNSTSNIITSKIKVVKSQNQAIAFFAYNYCNKELNIPFFRLSISELQPTLFMQLISDFIKKAIKEGCNSINIFEEFLSEDQTNLLIKMGFENEGENWKKVLLHKLVDSECFMDESVSLLGKDIQQILSSINNIEDNSNRQKLLLDLERKLYPLKFSDLDIPCYVIPIKPYWAGQLFDTNISDSTLFGAQPNKIWNRENVYYRNVKPITEIAPGRILWYVSDDNKSIKRKAIVASSYLDEVITGPSKNYIK